MPYTTFSDGSVLTASQVNTNFRDQVISTVTSGTRPSGTEGQMIFETDTDRFYVYSGSGWVEWGGIGAWVSYTPTLTQSGAVTKTVTYAKYTKIGRMVTVNFVLAVTGAGTANNPVNVGLPITAATSGLTCGVGVIRDSGVSNYPQLINLGSTTAIQFFSTEAGFAQAAGQTGAPFAVALAAGDQIEGGCTYEAAA